MRQWIPLIALATALAGCSGDSVNVTAIPANTPTTTYPQPGAGQPNTFPPANGGATGAAPGTYPAPQPNAPEPDPALVDPMLEIKEIQIDAVGVLIKESAPPQVAIDVKGILGDGCAALHEVKQQREGNTITVSITATRPKDATCTMIAKVYDEMINLDGDFGPGEYTVIVNGVEQTFKI